jgi:glucosyl-dolichyl phosphate glucuronosyltransferase
MIKHSIIIPTCNRFESLKCAVRSLIQSIAGQPDVEIIVVDNNSTPAASEATSQFCGDCGAIVRYLYETAVGQSAARHRGAREARGEILSYLDDDVEVSRTWLSTVKERFREEDVSVLGGPSIPQFIESPPEWLRHFIIPTPYGGSRCHWLSLLDIGRDIPRINPQFIWGLNFTIRKQVLLSCGGFSPDLVPDTLQRWQGDGESGLGYRLEQSGLRADYAHDALVSHWCGPERLTMEYFERKAFYFGVCASFSAMRRGGGATLTRAPVQPHSIQKPLRKRIRRSLIRLGRSLTAAGRASIEVTQRTRQGYKRGWRFHQEQVATDPILMEWVLRSDFFDVTIPSHAENLT